MKQDQGNALFLILIAVALFAALSYALTQSGRGGGSIDKETTVLTTSQMVQYASLVAQAVQRLQILNGCSDTEISFLYDSDGDGSVETNGEDDYYNSLAPSDESCHVFSPNGGGLTFQAAPQNIRDASEVTGGDIYRTEDYIIQGINQMDGVGTDGAPADSNELALYLTFLTQDACDAVNQNLGITGSNTQDNNIAFGFTANDLFRGSYNNGTNQVINDEAVGADLQGEPVGCLDETISGTDSAGYHFYYTLIAR